MSQQPAVGRPRFDPEAGTTVVDVQVEGDDAESIFAAMEAAAEALLPHLELNLVRPVRCMGDEECEDEPSVKLTLKGTDEHDEPFTVVVQLCSAHLESDLEKVLARVAGA